MNIEFVYFKKKLAQSTTIVSQVQDKEPSPPQYELVSTQYTFKLRYIIVILIYSWRKYLIKDAKFNKISRYI